MTGIPGGLPPRHDHDYEGSHDHAHGPDHSHDHGPRHDHRPGHDHDHGHGHSHVQVVTATNERRIRLVFVLTTAYAILQAVGGWLSGSLALIADSGHMVSDSAALLLALVAYRVARRPANPRHSYGFHRVRVLAALANGASLLVLIAWIAWEAVARINQPVEVLAGPMLVVAGVGLCVNLIGAWVLSSGGQEDANLHGAFLHVLGDLLGSVGAIAAAIGIMFTGWTILDPLLSVFVALLVLRSAWSLVWNSIRVLMQATPGNLDAKTVAASVAGVPGVAAAAHFHAWTLTDDTVVATVHVSPEPGADPLALPALVAAWLKDKFAIGHVTVQVDRTLGAEGGGSDAPGC